MGCVSCCSRHVYIKADVVVTSFDLGHKVCYIYQSWGRGALARTRCYRSVAKCFRLNMIYYSVPINHIHQAAMFAFFIENHTRVNWVVPAEQQQWRLHIVAIIYSLCVFTIIYLLCVSTVICPSVVTSGTAYKASQASDKPSQGGRDRGTEGGREGGINPFIGVVGTTQKLGGKWGGISLT